MVQVPVQPLTAEEYLRLTDWPYEGRLELEDGYIREVPTGGGTVAEPFGCTCPRRCWWWKWFLPE